MDNDRIKGAVKQKVGEAKEAAGKVLGDEKLKRKGQAEEVAGKVQNIAGGMKDPIRENQAQAVKKRSGERGAPVARSLLQPSLLHHS